MDKFLLRAKGIAKSFLPGRYIFRDVQFESKPGKIIAFTGANGSGKTTLMKTTAGMMRPSFGEITFEMDGKPVKPEDFRQHYGFVGPYLNVYDEFSPIELLKIFAGIRGIDYDAEYADFILKKFNIAHRGNDPVKEFSSGMTQRVKYVLALQHSPEIIFLDEPMSNLDQDGISAVLSIIFDHIEKGGAAIIATNEERDKALAHEFINL